MILSSRLQMIANEICKGETMVDIGTDHGFLPIYLWEKKICPLVIMADISKGSLQKAQENCKLYYPNEQFDLREGSGLEVIEFGEVDTVVIAGMGGILMTEILEKDINKSHSIKKYIVQPRNRTTYLREWLYRNGFQITKEQLVREGKYICEVITFVNGTNIVEERNPMEYEFPKKLLQLKDPLLKEYLLNKLNTEFKIKENMNKSKSDLSAEIEIIDERISYITRILKEVK